MSIEKSHPEFVSSLARGLAVVRAFGPDQSSLTLSEVARRTDMPRAAARRFLLTLENLGYVAREGRRFRLTPRVLCLGYAYLSSMGLWRIAEDVLEEVAHRVEESCSVAVLDGEEIVYVVRVPTKRIMSIALGVGTRLPAYPTSMGRVLLAALPPADLDVYFASTDLRALTDKTVTDEATLRRRLEEVALQGYAEVDQELELGVRSIAVPIRDSSGRVVAALNIGCHASRVTRREMKSRFLPVLKSAGDEIGGRLPA